MTNLNQAPTTFPDGKVVGGKKGISVVEILVVAAIITFALVSILTLATFSLKTSILVEETTKAKNIADETMEAVRNFRDNIDWTNNDLANQYDGLGIVSTGIAYHPEKSTDVPPKWMLLQGEEIIDGFTRKVVFENVSRDPITDDIEIIYVPANDDPETKKALVTVSWKNKKVEIISYLTNWNQ